MTRMSASLSTTAIKVARCASAGRLLKARLYAASSRGPTGIGCEARAITASSVGVANCGRSDNAKGFPPLACTSQATSCGLNRCPWCWSRDSDATGSRPSTVRHVTPSGGGGRSSPVRKDMATTTGSRAMRRQTNPKASRETSSNQ